MSEKFIPFGAQFQGIEVTRYQLEPALPTEQTPKVGFTFNITQRVSREEQRIQAELAVQVLSVDTEQPLGQLVVCCTFGLRGDVFADESTERLHEGLIDMINSISLSTTRGIVFSYFAKTYLHPLILPIIDPKEFRPESKQATEVDDAN